MFRGIQTAGRLWICKNAAPFNFLGSEYNNRSKVLEDFLVERILCCRALGGI